MPTKHLNEYVIPSGVKGTTGLGGWGQRNSEQLSLFVQ